MMKRLLPLAITALAAASCNTSGCLDNQNSIPLAGLYASTDGSAITVSTLQVHGIGAPHDSILIASGEAVSKLYLPMRSTADVTSWCFHYTQSDLSDLALNDTITFRYDSDPYFASEECGTVYYYRIRQCIATAHLIDSVVITDSLITNVDLERIKIFVRTGQPDDEQ